MTAAALRAFHADPMPDDEQLVAELLELGKHDPAIEAAIDKRASGYINAIRAQSGGIGGVEDFLRDYGLSTREGLALMVLAEALLRVPDGATQDRLIEDKLKQGGWSAHESKETTNLSI